MLSVNFGKSIFFKRYKQQEAVFSLYSGRCIDFKRYRLYQSINKNSILTRQRSVNPFPTKFFGPFFENGKENPSLLYVIYCLKGLDECNSFLKSR